MTAADEVQNALGRPYGFLAAPKVSDRRRPRCFSTLYGIAQLARIFEIEKRRDHVDTHFSRPVPERGPSGLPAMTHAQRFEG